MQEDEFSLLKLLNILSVVVFWAFVLAIELIKIDFDGLVSVTSMLGSAKGTNEGVIVAITVETDKIDLFVIVTLLRAVDVLYDVRGDFYFHYQRYIF